MIFLLSKYSLKITFIVWQWNSSIICAISFCLSQQKQGFKWLNDKQMQTHRGPFCTPKPDANLCMYIDLLLNNKTGKSGLGLWAAGPLRAIARRLLGLWVATLPRAMGLLLAKPVPSCVPTFRVWNNWVWIRDGGEGGGQGEESPTSRTLLSRFLHLYLLPPSLFCAAPVPCKLAESKHLLASLFCNLTA